MKKVSIKCKSNEIKRKKQQNELYLFAQEEYEKIDGLKYDKTKSSTIVLL